MVIFHKAGVEWSLPEGSWKIVSGDALVGRYLSSSDDWVIIEIVSKGDLIHGDFLIFLSNCSVQEISKPEHISFEQYRRLASLAICRQEKNTAHKFIEFINYLAREYGFKNATEDWLEISLCLTNLQIAKTLGISRETISTLNKEFKKKRFIKKKGKQMLINTAFVKSL